MPRRDGTGPMGQGQFSGRGLGNCITNVAGFAGAIAGMCFGFGRRNRQNNDPGRGFGRGPGRGFGWRGAQNLDKGNNQ